MIKIYIPENFIPERTYVIDILLGEFLGLEYQIDTKQETLNYQIILPNGNSLTIEDHFFSKFNESAGYLHKENRPSNVEFSKNEYVPENDIPIIYGTSKLVDEDIHPNTITCGLDIFSSAFFMLTRWEEYVMPEKDKHGRAVEHLTLSHKCNFYLRPVVNEYVELLWNLLKNLGCQGKRKIKKYEVTITHDVDKIARYDSIFKYFKAIAGDIIIRKNILLPFVTTREYFKVKLRLKKDNFDTFDYLMDLSESLNLKSRFYFIPSLKGEIDARYDITSHYVANVINNIIKRGHIVGIHGSFASYNKPDIFKRELLRIKKIHHHIEEGRQHYLRFENPLTWQIWEDNNLKTDSTMSFHSDIGFRSGTCYEYSVYHILRREKMKLKESPLLVMEQGLRAKYQEHNKMYDAAINLANTVKKYNGNYVFLWHNNNFFHPHWQKYIPLYTKIVKNI